MEFNQHIFNSLQDAIFIFSKDLTVIKSNSALNKFFNTLDLTFPISFIEINRNLDFHNFLKLAITRREISKLKNFYFDTIQTPMTQFFDISCSPLENSEYYICIFHDITERKNTEQIKEDFISNFSHEIKTPLTVLHGHIQVLKNDISNIPEISHKINPIIQKMEYNSTRMINLFNDLLLLSSVEKKSEIHKEHVEIEDNIIFLAQDLLVSYPEKEVIYTFEIEQKEFFIDIPLFEQILLNLLDNALKYGPSKMNISIQTKVDHDFDCLIIKDNGTGIPPNQIHRIFERFYRGEVSHSSSSKGTGLGLAIVKHIIQKHNAKIQVSSSLGVGTTFTLQFKKN